ncbi:MAG: fec operon regulator FecR [Bacteroidetes bacterium]|nr:fec operon regulator FecR [Bacteroidota bacterium]
MNNYDLTQDQIDSLIINVLGGVANAEDEGILRQWMGKSSANQRYYMQICDIWESSSADTTSFNKDQAYRRFKTRIAAQALSAEKRGVFVLSRFVRWTAVIVVAFVLGSFSVYVWNQYSQSSNLYTVTVPLGSKSKVELPDHTTVWLNAGSKLCYSPDFAKRSRQVSLEGEAYFEVAKNPKMPFTVNGREMAVKVLGTKFNVRSYREDPTVDITLLEGSISLTNHLAESQLPCFLKPNEKATLNKKNGQMTIEAVQASDWSEWTRGKLVFDAERFGQIIRRLEREYNVTIRVQDKELMNRKFYGDFRKAQSIQEIFDIMTASNQFRYKFKESVITVYK